jgi:hypothetical protein
VLISGQTIVIHSGDTATTVIAVVGLALAVLSFGWQAWSFSVSGSRVEVTIRAGMASGDKVASLAGAPTANELQRLAEQGFSEPVYVVKVHNRGRGATSVTDVDLYFSDGGAMGHTGIQRGLPRRVEGESDATFPIEANLATTYATAIGKVRGWTSPPMVRARVTIGAREKPVLSKNELPSLTPQASTLPCSGPTVRRCSLCRHSSGILPRSFSCLRPSRGAIRR